MNRPLVLWALLAVGCGGSAPPAPGGTALAKFCNFIRVDGQDGAVTLDLGGKRLQALTGACSSPVNAACTSIATGSLATRVLQGDKVLASLDADFEKDREYVLGVRASPDNPQQLVFKQVLLDGFRCAELDPMILILAGDL